MNVCREKSRWSDLYLHTSDDRPKIHVGDQLCREQGQPPRKYCVAHQAAMSGSLPSHMMQTPQEAQAVWLRMSRLL